MGVFSETRIENDKGEKEYLPQNIKKNSKCQFHEEISISSSESEITEEMKYETTENKELEEPDRRKREQMKESSEFYESLKTRKDDLWWLIFFVLTMMGVLSRLHYITYPNAVVWDETHFGKMAGLYLNRTFFFDVHPPGGKMLIALFGLLSGYNATHSFAMPGISYEGFEEILYMRVGCALIGAGMIPLSFLTVWELSSSLMASAFAGLLCCYEIGWINLSKFILLDPILMFFIMASFHALCIFHGQRQRAWGKKWWLSLVYNGLSLGCTLSIKFVGIFITLTVGLYTVLDLWRLFCDIKHSLVNTLKHFLARVLCLILIPGLVYLGIFFIHDRVLIYAQQEGGMNDIGSAVYTPAFQKRLINSSLYEIRQPAEVSYGSIVTIRNDNMGAGYLHSHNATYPAKYVKGNLQHITLINHKDSNNDFRILFPFDDPETEDSTYAGAVENIMNENWIRLFHVNTNATLACHKNKSVVASKMNLLYGRSYNLTPSTTSLPSDVSPFLGDVWMVRTERRQKEESVKTLRTRFQMIHPQFKCAIAWSQQKLPHTWGFHQNEASCTKNLKDPLTFLIVETVKNPKAPNASFDDLSNSFWERVVEVHKVMQFMNARLKPVNNYDQQDKPWMWPILYKSTPWYDNGFRIVLMGNPLHFLLNFMALVLTPILLLVHSYRQCRNTQLSINTTYESRMSEEQFIFSLKWIMIAYLFNYLPFYTMNRILYFHHYFPSQVFACLLTAVLMARFVKGFSGYFSVKRRATVLRGCVLTITLLLTSSFLVYCYVAYGVPTSGPFNLDNSTFRQFRFNDNWLI